MLQGKVLRVARPTDCLHLVVRFYTEGLGLHILDRFENHEGFDGVSLFCHFRQEIIWKAYSIRLLPKILISAILLENKRSNASSIYS